MLTGDAKKQRIIELVDEKTRLEEVGENTGTEEYEDIVAELESLGWPFAAGSTHPYHRA